MKNQLRLAAIFCHRVRTVFIYAYINMRHIVRTKKEICCAASYFKSNGFIKYKTDGISKGLGEIINEKRSLSNKELANDADVSLHSDGKIRWIFLNLEDAYFWEKIFTKHLFDLLRGYYGHDKFLLRNRPLINFAYSDMEHGAQNFHVDWGVHQVSLMINITDVFHDSTHMEYIAGTNKINWFTHPNRLSSSFKRVVRKVQSKKNCSKLTTISPRDATFLFDAGNGIHRQVLGGPRAILHMNFVDNLVFTDWKKNWAPEEAMNIHWTVKKTRKLVEQIEKSSFSCQNFSLLFQNMKPERGVPLFYSTNTLE